MAQQQLVLEPLGIVTEPNKLGQIPAGALSFMSDCVERSPGVIENIRSWQTRVTVAGTDAGTTAVFAVPMDDGKVVVIFNVTAGWKYQWYDMTTGSALYAAQALAFTSGTKTYAQSIDVSRQPGFSVVRFGAQTFVNAFSTVLVWDDPTGATLASSLVRNAGLQAPQLIGTDILSGSAGITIPTNAYAHYVVINTRTINGKKVVSPPSAAISVYNRNGTPVTSRVTIQLRAGDQRVGDVLEVYRTPTKPSGITGPFLAYQAGEEAGAEYQRVTTHTITSTDLSGGFQVFIFDDCPDTSLGQALYTNQAIEDMPAEPPPAVQLLTAYKGYMFGFATTRAPTIKLRPTGPWGGFEITQPIQTILSGFGRISGITGASYSSGSTTINVTPTSQLSFITVGAFVIGSFFHATVTAVGGSSITISAPTTGASASDTFDVFDQLGWNSGIGGGFSISWTQFLGGVFSSSSDDIGIRGQSLKLAPFTNTAITVASIGFPSQPTLGFDFYHRFLQDSRPQLGINSSKADKWDPQIANIASGTYTLVSEETLPRVFVNSEQDEPESWPFVNEDSFSRGTVGAVSSTSDAIICYYTDGIWRLSGTGGSAGAGYDWRGDPLATGITVAGSQAVTTLLDKPYAMTSEGLIVFDGTTLRNITQGRVHDQLSTPPWDDGPYTLSTATFLVEDEEHDEIIMREPSAPNGTMWIYNTLTDRLSQTASHLQPFYGFYSRALRSPVIVGTSDGSTWTLKDQSGPYSDFQLTYAKIYADDPFVQRHWQTLNVIAETAGATITAYFNDEQGETRDLDGDGRAGFEVPRNAPAIGNTMAVGLTVETVEHTKLYGFALDYRDHTERRRTR